MEETRYCICCGDEVRFNRIERNERIELVCLYCGFPLSVEDGPGLMTGMPVPDIKKTGMLHRVLVADDSKFTRKIIKDLLIEKNLAGEIMAFENGLDLTAAFSKLVEENKPVEVAVIDINMPVMDGITAARIIRNIEKQNKIPHIQIAFFSSVKADNNLKTQMEMLAPAYYVNKGTDPDPDGLAERVEKLFSHLMQAE